MTDQTDSQLLKAYVERRLEPAFSELVRRHVDFVYSAAIRMVRDPHLAQDVTQGVFIALARQAPDLVERATLGGWLHLTAHNIACQTVRTIERRRAREQEAVAMNELLPSPDASWLEIAPQLDAALGALSEADRDAVVLRYFEKKSAAEMAQILGVTDEAAQKRVSRAVEKLRELLSKRKVTIGASSLGILIAANAVQSAPVGLVATISAAATASTIVAATTKTIAMTTFQKTIIGATLAATVGVGIYEAHQAALLREENQQLQQEAARLQTDDESLLKRVEQVKPTPHLPAPQIQVAAVATNMLPEGDVEPTNLWSRLKDNQIKLTHDQIEAYLKANGRTAATLLAAFRTSGDPALLQEAMEKFPNDPQVDFEAAVDKNLSPDAQRQWLNTFKQSAPDNALANYLSALNYFNSGQIDQGVQELSAAAGKSLDDYTVSRDENDREAYLAAGYSTADASALGGMQLLLPQLAQMKQLGLDAVDLANAYGKTGDSSSAQAVLQMAANLGQGYAVPSPGESEISQLVGIYIEQKALQAMDPNSSYGSSGQTVQDQLNKLTQQRAAVKALDQQVTGLLPGMSDQDWIIYQNRWLMFGEENAQSWVVNKYGQK